MLVLTAAAGAAAAPGNGKGNSGKISDTTVSQPTEKTKGKGNTKKGKGNTKKGGGDTTASPTTKVASSYAMPGPSDAIYTEDSWNYWRNISMLDWTGSLIPDRNIMAMDITKRGTLITGWGDWDYNYDSFGTTRVGIQEVNPSTGAKVGPLIPVGSESFSTIRKDDQGNLYIPTTDPSDKAGYGQPHGNISGVWTDRDGTWRLIPSGIPMVHTYDVAVHGDDIYIVGSASSGGVVLRSSGGAPFEIIADKTTLQTDTIKGIAVAEDGTVFLDQWAIGPQYVYILDPETGQMAQAPGAKDLPVGGIGFSGVQFEGYEAKMEAFDGTVVATDGAKVYDLRDASRTIDLPNGAFRGYQRDAMYIDNAGALYVLSYTGRGPEYTLYKIDSFDSAPQKLFVVKKAFGGKTPTSFTVSGSQAHVGTSDGMIYNINLPK